MKKIGLIFAAMMLALPAWGQISNPSIIYTASAPSGSCVAAPPVYVLTSTGAVYTCNNGTWGPTFDTPCAVASGCTGATTAAGANLNITGVTQTGTLGNTTTLGTWLNGTQHITATAPITSAGTIAAYSTNAGGKITGLSAATSVTITFANSGWTNAAFCVANSSVAATQPYVTAQSNAAVTFKFPSLTGNLFYHCDGN